MKNNLFFVALLFVLLACASNKKAPLSLQNLSTSVNHTPLFSWQLHSDQRNLSQSAYRIRIAKTPEDLKSTNENVWDSGKINSSQSVLVTVSSPELKPAQTYFWKVKVWNQDNQESEWSETASFHTGLLSEAEWQNAKWIGYKELPAEKRMVPGIHGSGDHLGDKCADRPVVPLFRKEFDVNKKIKEATLYISGLGHYEASVNGQKVGNSFLAPGWTNYNKTVFYNSYDVTSMLQQGKNAIGAVVGNGFYNINRERYRKLVIAWGNPMLIGQLRIRFTDGTEQILVTDQDWKTAPSPITYTSIYGGEDYDAQLEQPGWNKTGFDEQLWQNAVLVTPPSGKLTEEKDYPLEIKESFSPQSMTKLNDGAYLYDFAQNASGIVELKVKGKKGQVVRLIPSELITAENQPNQSASGSPFSFSYTLKGDGEETWKPLFTYYGFRYVKVEGAVPASENTEKETARVISLKLLHNRNSTPSAGTFSCSNDLFNRTFNLINWGIKSNLQSVLTDCPHREKLGWLEQTFLMGSAVHFNFNLYQLYVKQVNDMMESQLENGLVPDIAPEYVEFGGGFRDSPEWGSAAVILPWLIYQWYGDASIMEKAWPMMVRYAEYLKSKSDGHIVSHGLGDWFDYGPRQPGEAQLTPKALTATSIYYYDVKLLSEMASILKKTDEQNRMASWASEIKTAFNARFFNPETGVISTGSQTAMAMPWCVGLVDEQYKAKVMQNLEDSIRAQGKPLTAGDVGFRYLVEALTNGGKSQLLFEMNARDDVPGYGFQLKKGATALTESWPALENVSNNHLMLGHLMDWFYAGLGGIGQSKTSVAYKEIVIKPEMVGDLTWVKASYQSPYGEIRSEWEKSGASVRMNITIPPNTTAIVYLPAATGSAITEGGRDIAAVKEIKLIREENGRKVIQLASGDYGFEIK
ncbi:MAG: family 78 glycoside hydrolase catalytic domain [Prolixibacteraceae bacterium]|nr:family 78 glycoside hydrolase catalytic domain [Prolixibacteraceae bacterium]